MNRFPIARISSKDYIKSLQRGELFLQHNMVYQRSEKRDRARSDPYDGSLPFSDNGILSSIAGEPLYNIRIMRFDAYVSCYYHYHCSTETDYYVPIEDKSDLYSFDRDTAIIIDTEKFEQRLQKASAENGIPIVFSDVFYYDNAWIENTNKAIMAGEVLPILKYPQFLKNEIFKYQREYRVSALYRSHFLMKHNEEIINFPDGNVAKKLYDTPITIEIGSIKDFSIIIPTEQLINSKLPKNWVDTL